jgi:Uma2 family endonuclease
MEEIRGRRGMLCFPQMATKAQITAEQYLHMTFEHDAEFVRGEIVDRPMPDNVHSLMQFLILMELGRLIQSHPLFPRPELRLRLSRDVYRIPDICVFAGDCPKQSVPSTPPLLVIEILSRDDRHHDLMDKRLSAYSDRGLQNVSSLSLADYPFELTPSVLFSDL